MTPHTALLSGPTSPRSSATLSAPILIQVPSLSSRPRPTPRPATPRVRRRLRREVRVAASTLLFALPMSWALVVFAKIGPEPGRSGAMAPTATVAEAPAPIEDGPRVTLGVEPAAPAEPDHAPIVVPAGYLIPDDGSEVSAHAGH